MKLQVKVDEDGFAPRMNHEGDAGLDILTPTEFELQPGEIGKVDTKFRIQGEPGYYYRVDEKSGLAALGIHIIGGIVDRNYTGHVHVVLQNLKNEKIKFERGAKIAQLIVSPVVEVSEVELVDEIKETTRGDGGFGSTGK